MIATVRHPSFQTPRQMAVYGEPATDAYSRRDQDDLRRAMQAMPPAMLNPPLPSSSNAAAESGRKWAQSRMAKRLSALMSDGVERSTDEVVGALCISPSYATQLLRKHGGMKRRRVGPWAYWRLA